MPQSKEAVQTSITHLYLALFGRAPDSEGLEFWTARVMEGQSWITVANTMLATEPARAIYREDLPAPVIITAFYENVLGRAPDAPGLAFWTEQLKASPEGLGAVVLDMLDAVINYVPPEDPQMAALGHGSQALFNNKAAVAQYMTQSGLPPERGAELLRLVSNDPGSVAELKSRVDAQVQAGSGNQAPTAVALADAVTRLAENTSIASPTQMATLVISDDALGVNTVSLSGEDAGQFLVQDGKLYLKPGTLLDFESRKSLSVTVNVTDQSVSGSSAVSSTFTLEVDDVEEDVEPQNQAPTSIGLTGTTTSLPENTSTASRMEVGTILVTDDSLGTNDTTLSGTDAASFEVEGGKLYLKAGTSLDYETKTSYDVTVIAQDTSIAGSTPVSTNFSLAVTNVNEAPTALTLSAHTLEENATVGTGIKVGDLTVTDPDASGNLNTLSLEGIDAAAFDIRNDTELYFKGTSPDFEIKSTYSISVKSTDGALTFSQPLTIQVTNVNEAPSAVALTGTTTSLPENTSTVSRMEVGTILVTDDSLGTNDITLSGTDAASFEVENDKLYLKAGTSLDYETKTSYDVTVIAQDTSVAGSTPVSTNFSLAVTNVNEAPTAVALTGTTTSLPENTSTVSRIEVGSVLVTDDSLGTNDITLSGTDASRFDVENGKLYLKAGTSLDYETKTSYDVTVIAQDASVAGSTPVSTSFSLGVTDIGGAPTLSIITIDSTSVSFMASHPDSSSTLTALIGNTPLTPLSVNHGAVTIFTFSEQPDVPLSGVLKVRDNSTPAGEAISTTYISLGTSAGDTLTPPGDISAAFSLGFGGNDVIFGTVGVDRLDGGSGNDSIEGGAGNDTLLGGEGSDTFKFDATGPANGIDTIADFIAGASGDILDFSQFAIDSNTSAAPPFNLSAVFTAKPPGNTPAISSTIVRLIDVAGNQDITQAEGLRLALAQGGEYSSIDMTANSKAIIITSAADSPGTAAPDYVFLATADASAAITVSLVGMLPGVTIDAYTTTNFMI